MKNNYRNVILIIAVILIVIASFFIPKIVFEMRDLQIEKKEFVREKITSKVDPQIEDVYMINSIHQCYYFLRYYQKVATDTLVSYASDEGDRTIEELGNLSDYGIINKEILDTIKSGAEKKGYMMFNGEAYLTTWISYSKGEKDNTTINLLIDTKNYKILSMNIHRPDVSMITKEGKEAMEAYTQYLGLDFIDDWTYINDSLESKKANLRVIATKEKEGFRLMVLPLDINVR